MNSPLRFDACDSIYHICLQASTHDLSNSPIRTSFDNKNSHLFPAKYTEGILSIIVPISPHSQRAVNKLQELPCRASTYGAIFSYLEPHVLIIDQVILR